MPLALIALGGNQPESPDSIAYAVKVLDQRFGSVQSVSNVWQTPAMGRDAGVDFVNAALCLKTDVAPDQLLQELHALEATCGRERVIRWGPRTLDLDLLQYNQLVVDLPRIVIPHPQMWFRAFVLGPLAEIAPDVIHPLTECSVQTLYQRVSARPILLDWLEGTGGRLSGLTDMTAEVRRRTDQSSLLIRPVGDSDDQRREPIARLRIRNTAPDDRRTQPPHAPPFVIDIEAEDRRDACRDESVIQQVCDVVTAIAG